MKNLYHLSILVIILLQTFVFATKYDTMLENMKQLANSYPEYVQLMDIGKNDQNMTIYGLKVENNQYSLDRAKTPQLLVGCHHGNEYHSADVCITFTKQLVAIFNNTQDALYKNLSRSVFYVIPVLNISGYNSNSRYEKGPSGSYDPNRDYPDPCESNRYFQLASIRNLANFVERYGIVGAVTAHGYVGTLTYPWGIYTSNYNTKDNAKFSEMAKFAVEANGYRTGTHGAIVYPASGAFEDWAYHAHGIWVMLIEHKRSPNLDKDALCLLRYFSVVPTARSSQHVHEANNCRAKFEAFDTTENSRP